MHSCTRGTVVRALCRCSDVRRDVDANAYFHIRTRREASQYQTRYKQALYNGKASNHPGPKLQRAFGNLYMQHATQRSECQAHATSRVDPAVPK